MHNHNLLTKNEAWDRLLNRITALEAENQSLRAASTPEAAGRGDGQLIHELWYQGGRLRSELSDAFVLHAEIFHEPALKQLFSQWDVTAAQYAERFAAPPSGEQSQPCDFCDNGRCTVNDGGELVAGSECLKRAEKNGCEGCGEPIYLTRNYGYSHVDTTLNVGCDARPKPNHPSVPKVSGRSSDFNNEEKLQSGQQSKASELARTDAVDEGEDDADNCVDRGSGNSSANSDISRSHAANVDPQEVAPGPQEWREP